MSRRARVGAFRQLGPTKLAVFTVVNAVGAIVNRAGQVVRGNLNPRTGERYHPLAAAERRLRAPEAPPTPPGNTTITLLVTNQRLDTGALQQLGPAGPQRDDSGHPALPHRQRW